MMNACPRCGLELLGYNDDCPGCGYTLRRRTQTMTIEPPAAHAPQPASTRPAAPVRRRTAIGLLRDFFTFRMMIGPAVIRFIYAMGVIIGSIWVGSITLLNTTLLATLTSRFEALIIPLTLLVVVLYNISWRISCELMMLRYDANERLAKLTEKGQADRGA